MRSWIPSPIRCSAFLVLALVAVPTVAAGQTGSAPQFDHASAPAATATRTRLPIEIDGRKVEDAWAGAMPITEFTQVEPNEWAPVSERTEVRILFDDYNLYIGASLYDTGPLSTRLGRRDSTWPDTDAFIVFLDTYHDHRTAYRFTVNPSGVKRDEIITIGGSSSPGRGGPSGTGFGDTSWDPVWEVATHVTDEGWFVEMRIPFGQLGYAPGEAQHWGLQLDRRIGRKLEHASWSFTPARERATVARFGHLEGLEGIRGSGKLEMLPFMTGRAEYRRIPLSADAGFVNPFRSGRDYFADGGVDLKYRATPNFTVTATLNPDFGQVEMDPADLNLSAFETRLSERRPFFVEGAEIFRFGESGGMNTQLLYTRRIGRSPQVAVPAGTAYADVPPTSTILGAVKLAGKSQGGWSLGMLEAVTNREIAPFVDRLGGRREAVVEPLSNYFAVRARRDLRQGQSSFGALVTTVNRRLEDDPALVNRLHAHAFAGGLDFRHDWDNRAWSLSGELTPSLVLGDPAALLRTQRTSARYLQRPDADHLEIDPEATSLAGYGAKVDLARQSGALRGGFTLTAISPTYEINDLGFQTNADRLNVQTELGYDRIRPGRYFRRWNVGTSPNLTWNYAGDLLSADVGVMGGAQLLSYYGFGGRISRSLPTWNDRLTRGGPLTRDPGSWSGNLNFNTDNRLMWSGRFGGGFNVNDAGGWRWSVNSNLTVRPSPTYEIRIGPSFNRNRNLAQYVSAVTDPFATDTFGRRYLFATLEQSTLSLDTRVNVTFTPNLTLEMFAEPFISSGEYGALKQLAEPRTFDFLEFGRDIGTSLRGDDGRFTIDPDGDGPAASFRLADQSFNYHSLLGNAVLRYEWRPGSTVFFVWQQSRTERLTALEDHGRAIGSMDFEKDARALLGIRPENIFMVKINYWLNP
jgi:hypothetical protein